MRKDLDWLKKEVVESMKPQNLSGKSWGDIGDGLLKLIEQVEEEKKELPAIPKYVADWLKENKSKYDSILHFASDYYSGDVQANVYNWILENNKVFSIAWLVGYRIEERKYYARIKGADQHFARDNPTYLKREVKDKGYELVYLKVDADLLSKSEWRKKGVTKEVVDFEGR